MRVVALVLLLTGALAARAQSVDDILRAYINAVGGQAAIDRIHTRRLEASSHRIGHDSLTWSAPDKALRVSRDGRAAFDGALGWEESKKKKILKLPHSRVEELETDANPIRFAGLRDMYHDLHVDKPATLDGVRMDVLTDPNAIGATRFFFDHSSHLLMRIEELGVTSAYYKHTTSFEDYKIFDGIRLPTRILRTSEEPGSEKGDLHLSKIEQNVRINEAVFRKPDIGTVITGGKH